MRSLALLLLALLACTAFCSETEVFVNNQKRILVVGDSLDVQDTHSQFFKQLQQRGYTLKFARAKDAIALTNYGDYLFDNLIILATNVEEFGGELSAKSINEFIEAGHNVFISASTKLPEPLREVANDMGVEFDADNTNAIDHFNHETTLDSGSHTVVVAKSFAKAPVILGSSFSKTPVLFYGVAMSLDPENKLAWQILGGSPTAYSYNPNESISEEPHVKGQRTTFVAGVQSKRGGRATFVGSLDLLSNKFFDAQVGGKPSGNREFATALSEWSFQERGFLRHRDVLFTKKGEKEVPKNYRVSEDLEYTVFIEEWRGDKWVPFDASDVQLEFIMLDPYIRTTLKHQGQGKYYASFKTPDVYGVFKFKVDYRREGYSILNFADQVIVRPMRLNEYERYIYAAFPYYASTFSIMIGLFIFSLVFLYTRDKEKKA